MQCLSALQKVVIFLEESFKVCAGHDAGGEVTRHAVHSIFEEKNAEGMLLIVAGDAFKTINRKLFRPNAATVYPAVSTCMYNCYAMATCLLLCGECETSSVEGITR